MWKALNYENESRDQFHLPFYLKVVESEARDAFRVLLTNNVKLWKREFNKLSFQEMMLLSNQDVETDDKQIFLNTGLCILHNPKLEDKKKLTETTTGNIHVELLRLGPIVWKASFELTLCDAEDFFYFVTRPLLMAIKDQIQSESSLRSQLLKKDQEIQGFLEMLPENSPLMRCLRTKKYNDQEHRLNHNAVTNLYGTDPEEVICPQQIIQYKRALPVLKYDDNTDEPNRHEIRLGPETSIKIESTNGGSLQSNSAKIPQVKHEPINCIGKTNDVKIESKDGTSELIPIKIEPHDGVSKSNVTHEPNHDDTVSNDNQSQTKGANKTAQSSTRNSVQSNPESLSTGDEEMGNSIADHSLNTRKATETLHPISPDTRPSEISPVKKRRKNLNY